MSIAELSYPWCEMQVHQNVLADSTLIIVGLFCSNSTRHDRQSAALLHAPDIHSKVMLYVASSSPHLLTLLFAFFPFRNLASGLLSFLSITSAP